VIAGEAGTPWLEIVISGALELAINVAVLAFFLGRLSERVEVLWLAVFNHLGLDPESTRKEWRRKHRPEKGDL